MKKEYVQTREAKYITITEAVFNFAEFICQEIKSDRHDENYERVVRLLPQLIIIARADPKRKVSLNDVWKHDTMTKSERKEEVKRETEHLRGELIQLIERMTKEKIMTKTEIGRITCGDHGRGVFKILNRSYNPSAEKAREYIDKINWLYEEKTKAS